MKVITGVLALLTLVAAPSLSFAAKPCAGLSGAKRTACLKAEVARTASEAAKASRKAERLNRAMKVACGADLVAPAAASRATPPLLGRAAYKAGRAMGNKAMKTRDPCVKIAS